MTPVALAPDWQTLVALDQEDAGVADLVNRGYPGYSLGLNRPLPMENSDNFVFQELVLRNDSENALWCIAVL